MLTFWAISVHSQAIRLVNSCLEATLQRVCDVARSSGRRYAEQEEGALSLQPPASICVRAQQSIVELNTNAKPYWRTMGFEPLAGPKNVTAFAMFEEGGSELAAMISKWLKDVSDMYEVRMH